MSSSGSNLDSAGLVKKASVMIPVTPSVRYTGLVPKKVHYTCPSLLVMLVKKVVLS
jgi:hypothetical protein